MEGLACAEVEQQQVAEESGGDSDAEESGVEYGDETEYGEDVEFDDLAGLPARADREDAGGESKGESESGDGDPDQPEKKKQKQATNNEEAEEDNEVDDDLSGYVYTFGAHGKYEVPQSMVVHQASKPLKATPEEMGNMLRCKTGTRWSKLRWFHIHFVAGKNKHTGLYEYGPCVCFQPVDENGHPCVEASDDARWMRPVPPKTIEDLQDRWRAEIKRRAQDDVVKEKQALDDFKRALTWKSAMLTGQKLDPNKIGIGKGLFKMLPATEKLHTLCLSAEKKKPVGGKSSGKSGGKSGGDGDGESNAGSDVSTVLNARTVCIGPAETTHTFVSGNQLYATLMPS